MWRVLIAICLILGMRLTVEGAYVESTDITVPKDSILLTIVLQHDQDKTLTQIQQQLKSNGFFEKFPPPGVEVVSWNIAMGLGQVITLRMPPDRLRDVNVALETTAWGSFHTQYYPTYDYRAILGKLKQAE
jgi:hypothetical protein